MPRLDPLVRASEELVLRHNPDWSAGDWTGRIPSRPRWSRDEFVLRAMFFYDEGIPFTQETWRGRIRALRGIGAALSPSEVEAFDRAHAKLLSEIAPSEFSVLHRIDAHIFEPLAGRPESALA